MAAAQRWVRKLGWAASFQGVEVVWQHHAANRGGVAIAGPQHISSNAPPEFESMPDEAALLESGGPGTWDDRPCPCGRVDPKT